MKIKNVFLAVISLVLFACAKKEVKKIKLNYKINQIAQSNVNGEVKFLMENDTVTMTINASGLVPGEHAIHIHENGVCDDVDGKSAGGHWNPEKKEHGKWGSENCHNGDIGNLIADENGNAFLEFKTNKWCIDCKNSVNEIIGRSIIIHAGVDDFITQPTGNAGGRVGCVAIQADDILIKKNK